MAKIFNDDIHNADFLDRYLEHLAGASNLLQVDDSDTKETLNGTWSFMEDVFSTSLRAGWFQQTWQTDAATQNAEKPQDWDYEGMRAMAVPSVWNLAEPQLYYYEGAAIYTRSFSYQAKQKGERVFLHFEGIATRATVILNNQVVGTHFGASTPFSCEITATVQADNRLFVVVDASRPREGVPCDNFDWFNYGGIYRDVYLVRRPQSFIRSWNIALAKDPGFNRIMFSAEVADLRSDVSLQLEIPELGVSEVVDCVSGKAAASLEVEPHLWSPDDPYLYEVSVTLIEQGKALHSCHEKIGFRDIRVEQGEILLNGKKIILKGICVHEDDDTLGKTTNEGLVRTTIRDIKDMNGNYARLAHYPHSRLFARIADEMGLLLWEELPVYWGIDFANPKTFKDAENQLAELIARDANRASVIIWSVGNENADAPERLDFMARLAHTARIMDSTRLISAACLIDPEKLLMTDPLVDELDVLGINEYYGWYDPDVTKVKTLLDNSAPSKPVIMTEFGACAVNGFHASHDVLFTEERQEWIFRRQVEVFAQCPYIKGYSPWLLYDFRSPRRLNHFQAHYNRKGLIASDKKTRKKAFSVMADYYKNL